MRKKQNFFGAREQLLWITREGLLVIGSREKFLSTPGGVSCCKAEEKPLCKLL